ncbi:hypothetical protein COT97_04120 [Candidatus Falkowbacteria bacterium CG10_big_fil_rev_8_21_14_0_10_39_11]|uniref:Lipoprotein n=1 Tax=Candidatus Falkowbacteria bacterium CG10_big_fil_rev_8_21_14_0_10_39_11 TaxID=1974565 RepID=A0A2H0V475_9BACT|nr:MAG: hypothetical protein COT97_04120 [Candidatus Falkowbacteria bacterium CG10_big_fil_rev_8_21_14_0_10_39_11]
MNKNFLLIALMMVLGLTGCTSIYRSQQVVDRYGGALDSKIESVNKVAQTASELASVTVDFFDEQATVIPIHHYDPDTSGNLLLVQMEDLKNLGHASDKNMDLLYFSPLQSAVAFLDRQTDYDDSFLQPGTAANSIQVVQKTKYLGVIRTTKFIDPVIQQNDWDEVVFDAGSYTGDIVFYNLESQKYIGAFNFYAENSDGLDVYEGEELKNLRNDLWSNTRKAINAKWTKYQGESSLLLD